MLITILCLIGLVVVAMVAVRVFGGDHQQSSSQSQNRYKKRKRSRQEPKLKRVAPTFHDDVVDSDDPDEVLGLKARTEPKAIQSVSSKPAEPKVVAFYLVAPADQEFIGYDLLQAILSVGFRYGDMKIFHRHADRNGKGPVLFSMSSISEPGTFDLPNIGGFSCRGLTMFMQYDRISDPVHALDMMVDAAVQLQDELGGRLLAGDRQPLDEQTINHYRQKIEAFVLQHTEQL